MAFTNPIWLWALTGLLIPIGIHLLSRKEGSVILLGSIRHIEDSSTAQFKKVKLNEMVLLLVRCLLILWIVFFLSELHCTSEPALTKKLLLIEQGLEKDYDFVALIDSLKKEDYDVRFLTRDFPPIDDEVIVTSKDSYWSLVESLHEKPLQHVIVLSYNYAERFKGKRIALPENVQWISKTPSANEFPLASIKYTSGDSVWNRYGVSTATGTKFNTVITSGKSDSSLPPDTLEIIVVSDQAYDYDSRIILAVLKTLEMNTPFAMTVRTGTPEMQDVVHRVDWIFWLSDQKPPETNSSLITIANPDHNRKNRIVESISRDHWQITSRLNEGVALRHNLTLQLAELLLPKEYFEDVASQQDRRMLPDSMAWNTSSMQAGITPLPNAGNDSGIYWIVLILITLIGERILASIRKQ